MNRRLPKGTQVSHARSSARKTLRRRTAGAGIAQARDFEGNGTPSLGGLGRVSATVRMAGLLALVVGAFLAIGVTAASAKFINKGEISGPATGESFGLLKSESVAVDATTGHIYIADSSDGTVYEFDSPVDTTGAVFTGAPIGTGSVAVAVDDTSGDVYVSDSAAKLIKKFDADGNPIAAFGDHETLGVPDPDGTLAGLKSPAGSFEPPPSEGSFGIAVDQATGNLYAIDAGHEVVDAFDESGAFLPAQQVAGEPVAFGCGGLYTDGVAIDDSDGALLLSNSCDLKIYAFDLANGVLDSTFGDHLVPAGEPNEGEPEPNGTLSGRETPAGSFGSAYTSVATDNFSGDIYVNDTQGSVVDRFTSVPNYLEQITGAPAGSFGGLAFDASDGTLLVAENGSGKGSVKLFAEPVPEQPTVISSVDGVSDGSAELIADINPHQLETTYHFEYDTTPYGEGEGPHGTVTPIGSAGSGEITVTRTASIAGLNPNTTYYFRAVASNSLGTVFGTQRSFITQGTSTSLLPDDRGWELVSPAQKHGGALEAIAEEGGLIQAAANGDGIAYFTLSPPDAEPAGNRGAAGVTQLLSARAAAGGWSTADLATPHQDPAGYSAGDPSEYKLFSTDLTLAALEPEGATPLSPQAREPTPYLRGSGGEYTPLVTGANVPAGVNFGGIETAPERFSGGVTFITATPDMSHLLLRSPQPLTEDFPPTFQPSQNVFEESDGQLRLISWLPTGSVSSCGGSGPACHPDEVPGDPAEVGNESQQVRNAISTPDGLRVFFSTKNSHRLYLRDLARGETLRLDGAQGVSEPGEAGAAFQFASAEGSRVFFTDTQPLTHGAAPNDLYMCQIELVANHLACALSDLTPSHVNPTEPANVQGAVIGAATDGSNVYFVANGVLTNGETAVSGDCGRSGEFLPTQSCNLYRYDLATGKLRLVAVLSGADAHDWGIENKNLGLLTARVSPNGRYLAFMSQRPLTGYDNRDVKTGVRDQEVYLYDAEAPGAGEGKLLCASCDPGGARPRGVLDEVQYPGLLVDRRPNWPHQTLAANLPGWTNVDLTHALYQSRYLSDSGRLFFNAADSLVPQDSNGTFDVYEFEFPQGEGQPASNTCTTSSPTYGAASGGCVSLISSGTSPEESAFMDASESGDDVFFLTQSRLTGKDTDTAFDLYDARVGGDETEPVKPVECSGDACQQPAVPPNDATPGSLTFQGVGNVLECPKGKVKQKGKCVKKKQSKKKSKKHKKGKKKNSNKKGKGKKGKRAAGHKRGGQK
jgi:hypothetical protein